MMAVGVKSSFPLYKDESLTIRILLPAPMNPYELAFALVKHECIPPVINASSSFNATMTSPTFVAKTMTSGRAVELVTLVTLNLLQ